MLDNNGNSLQDWIRWHEAQCGHTTTERERRMMIELIAAGYVLERPTASDAAPPLHRL